MRTSAQARANRANAQLSTGPVTPQGKRRSRLNAMRHGLTAQAVVMPFEEIEAYQRLAASYFDELQPKGPIERQFVQTLADTAWRMNRIRIIENNLFATGGPDGERSPTSDPEIRSSLAMVAALSAHVRDLAVLSIHEQRLSRIYERALKQLADLQSVRRAHELEQMENAATLRKLHEAKELSYDPAEDGFVFSIEEIDRHIHRADRLQHARRAAYHDYQPDYL